MPYDYVSVAIRECLKNSDLSVPFDPDTVFTISDRDSVVSEMAKLITDGSKEETKEIPGQSYTLHEILTTLRQLNVKFSYKYSIGKLSNALVA